MTGWILGFCSAIIASLAQILLKKSAQKKIEGFWAKYLNVKVISAYGMLFFSMFLNTLLLRVMDLKYLPCITATNFLWILLFSYFFLGERPSKNKVLGTMIIILGVIVSQF